MCGAFAGAGDYLALWERGGAGGGVLVVVGLVLTGRGGEQRGERGRERDEGRERGMAWTLMGGWVDRWTDLASLSKNKK